MYLCDITSTAGLGLILSMMPPRQERHRRSSCCDVSEFGRIYIEEKLVLPKDVVY